MKLFVSFYFRSSIYDAKAVSRMSGHWRLPPTRNRQVRYANYPLLRRLNSHGCVKIIERLNHVTSKTSEDPFLISKPVEAKIPGKPHETDR